MKNKIHKADICVIGGGLAGMCAAIAAARHGAKVMLMHDRPVFGGNASSEIRMWVCGAHGENNLETGIIEEILLENLHRNNYPNYSVWDSILYEKVRFQKNLTSLLNCSCNQVEMDGQSIKSITGWQLTTETWHTVEAKYFADCSGDSILAPLTGAEFRLGREAKAEFNESIAPAKCDKKTMGMSCLIQSRETSAYQAFTPPDWAYTYKTDADLPNRFHDLDPEENFWWIELGGTQDTINDTEELRDELLKIAFGVWDHIKNYGHHGADNWVLEWIGFLPGKRESRRYVGDHILTQNDISSQRKFNDIVAFGGWPMDDHFPEGFHYPGYPTIFHEAPSPYGIPYRSLYSKNIDNLFFAGRNISVTHTAMSSTRVMATCATLGQAVGTAAAVATQNSCSGREIYTNHIKQVQQILLNDDCYLPWKKRDIPEKTFKAQLTASSNNPEPLRNGIDRQIKSDLNAWETEKGGWVQYSFGELTDINKIRIIFDSNLNRQISSMPCMYPLEIENFSVPPTMVSCFHIDVLTENEKWEEVFRETNNHQRLVKIKIDLKIKALKLTIDDTWGNEKVNIFACDVY